MSVAGASSAMMPCHHRPDAVLQVHVVDPRAPVAQHAASGSPPPIIMCPVSRHSPMSDTSSTRAHLPRRLDVGPGLRVEGRLVAAVAAAGHHLGEALPEPLPRVGVQAERRVRGRPARLAPARLVAVVGQGGPRRRPRQVRRSGVERVEQRVQFAAASARARRGRRTAAPGTRPPGRAPAPRAARPASPRCRGSRRGRGRCPRSRPRPPGRARSSPLGNVRVMAHRDLERAVADRRVRDHDAGSGTRGGSGTRVTPEEPPDAMLSSLTRCPPDRSGLHPGWSGDRPAGPGGSWR